MQNGAFNIFAQTFYGIAFADEVRHSFAENTFGVVDFLEARNFAHQVKAERFCRKDGVVKLARNSGVALGGLGVGEDHRVRIMLAEA